MISAVGNNHQAAGIGSTGTISAQIKEIDKQIGELQKKVQQVNADQDMDAETKSATVQQYQTQIQQLQAQKSRIQAEESRARQERVKGADVVQPSREQEMEQAELQKQGAFVKMDTAKRISQSLGTVRTALEGELRTAESSTFTRIPDPLAAAEAREKLSEFNRTALKEERSAAKSISLAGELEADSRQVEKSGTGRMEPGQYLDEEV